MEVVAALAGLTRMDHFGPLYKCPIVNTNRELKTRDTFYYFNTLFYLILYISSDGPQSPLPNWILAIFLVQFLAGNQLYELQSNRWGWWWGWGGKKSIAIFAYKQRLLSIEMKTKLVQHVESEWMRDWKSVRVRERECVRVRAWECESDFWA